MTRPLTTDGLCACRTCLNPIAAVAADLRVHGLFRCAACGAIRLLPAAGLDDADCVGEPVCGPCMRRDIPETPKDYFRDGTDDEFADCCGACSPRGGGRCTCRIGVYDGYDRETGFWTENGCMIHGGRT